MPRAKCLLLGLLLSGCDAPSPVREGTTGGTDSMQTTGTSTSTSTSTPTSTSTSAPAQTSGSTGGISGTHETSESGDSTTETSATDDSSSTGAPPERPAPVNRTADTTWVVSSLGFGTLPTHVRAWNGGAALIAGSAIGAGLVFGEGTPSEQTLSTSGGSLVAVAVFDAETGAVSSTHVLNEGVTTAWPSAVPNSVSDVMVDTFGVLTVAGGWSGETTFFPGTADEISFSGRTEEYIFVETPAVDAQVETALLQLDPDGSPRWLDVSDASQQPWPVTFDAPRGLANFGDGSVFLTSHWNGDPITFPVGTPEPFVSDGDLAYFGQFDGATGEHVWSEVGDASFIPGLADSADGLVFTVLDGENGPYSGTYFEGTSERVTLPRGDHLARINAQGELDWVVTAVHEDFGGAKTVTAAGDGGAALLGYSGGGLVTLQGLDGFSLTTTVPQVFHPRSQWFARVNGAGSATALEPIPDEIRIGYPTTPYLRAGVSDGRGFWYGGWVRDQAWFVDGPPEAAALSEDAVLLIHVGNDGLVDDTRVLGQGFVLDSLDWTDGTQQRLFVSGSYPCASESAPGLLQAGDLVLHALPTGCPAASPSMERVFVASIDLGG